MDGRLLTLAALALLGGASSLRSRAGSSALPPGSVVDEMAGAYRKRFPRWNDAGWEAVVTGPTARLARALHRHGASKEEASAVLAAWLELAGEIVGLELADPDRVDTDPIARIWFERVPADLASLPDPDRYSFLADLFNATEAVAKRGDWYRNVLGADLDTTGPLRDLVKALAHGPSRAATGTLSGDVELHWIQIDPKFLPGDVEFVSGFEGRLIAVTDRMSKRVEGLWLSRTGPVRIGPFKSGKRAPLKASGLDLWDDLAARDANLTRRYHAAKNDTWAVASLVTSRYVVCAVAVTSSDQQRAAASKQQQPAKALAQKIKARMKGTARQQTGPASSPVGPATPWSLPLSGRSPGPSGRDGDWASPISYPLPPTPFDRVKFDRQVGDVPSYEPLPDAMSAAIVNDLCRVSGTVDPLSDAMWTSLGLSFPKRGEPRRGPSSSAAEHLSVLAFFLDTSSLGPSTLEALRYARSRGFLLDRLSRFLDVVLPIPTRELLSGPTRQELFRRWVAMLGGQVAGQSPEQSRATLERMDRVSIARDAAASGLDLFREERIRKLLEENWVLEQGLGGTRE